MTRFACVGLTLNLLLLTLTSCSLLPLVGVTESPPPFSASPPSSLTVYAGVNADPRTSALIALRAEDGDLRWQASVDAVGGTSVGATLGEDVLYSASRDAFAVAKYDGALLWHTPLAGLAGEPLALTGGVLLVPRLGYTQRDTNGHPVLQVAARVDAIQARTGEVVWRSLDTAGQVVTNGGIAYGRSNDLTRLIALRVLDGTVRWRSDPLGGGQVGAPIVAGDTVYAATLTGDVVALRTADGTLRWKVHLVDRNIGALVVSDGNVYASLSDPRAQQGNPPKNTDSALVALRASDGTQVWRIPTGGRSLGTPTAMSGVLYVSDGDGFSARRATDGTLLWHVRSTDIAPALACSCPQQPNATAAPVVADGHVFAALSVRNLSHSEASVIVALDAQTGATLWRYPRAVTLPGLVGSFVVGS
jgi:outer membrane protein assembly factor BamB